MAKDDKKELWISWARDAIGNYSMPDDIEDAEELANDMVDVATAFADAMLEEFEKRFEGGRGRGRRKAKPDPDLDDDDDDDDDDE